MFGMPDHHVRQAGEPPSLAGVTSATPSPEGFLGEAASLDAEAGTNLGRVDWSATSIGTPSTWPPPLRSALRTMLASRFPMWLGWGPELAFFCNDAFRRATLGRAYAGALGRPAREAWAEVWPEIAPRIDSVLATGQGTWDEALPLILDRFDQPRETFHTFSLSALHDETGLIAGVLCVTNEDTERVIAARQAEKLGALDAAKTAFFTNVSHEFRTPLTLLLGPAHDGLTDHEEPLTQRQYDRLRLIKRNGDRLLQLVDNLLDFSRLEANRMTAAYEPLDLAALTSELVSMFRSAYERAGLALTLEIEPIDTSIYVDREMWTKIVCNLLANALKFTFLGGVVVTLRRTDPGHAALTVADTGVGIAPEDQPLVFERFHRSRATRTRTSEGTGIGLALVADLAALHGGEASLSSTLGEGTTVVVRIATGTRHLPPEAVRETAAGRPGPGPAAAAGFLAETDRWFDPAEVVAGSALGVPDGPRRRVLVVDDNADMREYIAGLLHSQFDVRTAQDGRAALASALADVPDLVLTDVMMAGLDGFGLLGALRADRRTALVPVVMLSARAGEEAAIAGMAAGADDYLAKPFSASELFARVHANLELARLRTQDASWRRVLMDTIQDPFAVADSDGMLLEVNDAFRELVGYPIDNLPARRPHPWWPDPHTDPEAYAELAAAWAQIAEADSGRVTVPFRHANGHRLWIEVMYGSLRDPRTGQRLVVGSFRDETARTEAVEEQRSVALTLQRSLLGPSRMPAGFAARYSPGERPLEVGGDWYDVIDLGEGEVGLVVGDCVGKGLDAATVMGQLRSACRALLLQLKRPAEVLSALDDFAAATPHAEYTSVFCAVIDRHSGNVQYSTAGHPPAVLTHPDGRIEMLDNARSVPLAGSVKPIRTQAHTRLDQGSLLVLYTDGLAERRGEHPDVGIGRLAQAVRKASALQAEDDVAAAVLRTALPVVGQADDVALLLYRHRAPADFHTRLRPHPAALAPARAALRRWLSAHDVARMELEAILLAAGEACANALEHGHRLAGEDVIDLIGTICDGRLELVVRDRGAWKEPSDRGYRGRGLELMELLMDRARVESGPQGTTVRLSKELSRAD